MSQTRRTSTAVRVVSALAVVSLVVAGCGSSDDDAGTSSPSSSTAPSSSGAPPAPAGTADDAGATAKAEALADTVTLDGAMTHVQAFQDIANRNGGNRALGSPGYRQSVEYAEKVLREAGYRPVRQEFPTSVWSASKVQMLTTGAPVKADALISSGATDGAVTAKAVVTGTQGCTAEELQKVTGGTIAVVQRGTCPFGEKYQAAAAKGAAALVITNNKPGDWKGGTLGLDDSASIAVVGVARDAPIVDGNDLTLTVDAKTVKSTTWNILAETVKGDADNVQMVGAHLDSVAEGPGINDNATGTSAVLATATALGVNADVKNKVRFALWGAEEDGLFGSEHYVSTLSAEQSSKIKRYLNFDMLGSPNGGYFALDGDGSGVIEQVFANYFAWRNVPLEAAAFDGRSDYGPFTAAGIASGGVDVGVDEKKTDAQRDQWGGTAGETFDPNYHSARDTVANVNRDMYRIALGSVAYSTAYFAAL